MRPLGRNLSQLPTSAFLITCASAESGLPAACYGICEPATALTTNKAGGIRFTNLRSKTYRNMNRATSFVWEKPKELAPAAPIRSQTVLGGLVRAAQSHQTTPGAFSGTNAEHC